MKKLILGLTLLVSISSFAGSVDDDYYIGSEYFCSYSVEFNGDTQEGTRELGLSITSLHPLGGSNRILIPLGEGVIVQLLLTKGFTHNEENKSEFSIIPRAMVYIPGWGFVHQERGQDFYGDKDSPVQNIQLNRVGVSKDLFVDKFECNLTDFKWERR